MQTKNKQNPQKVLSGFSSNIDLLNDFQGNSKMQEFVECGAICRDGSYTHINGRGAGSRHGGIKHKLYAKRSEVEMDQTSLSSKASLQAHGSNNLSSKIQAFEQTNLQSQIPKSINTKKKTQGKIKLKQYFKTKTKRLELFDKVHVIFEKSFKDLLQISHEEIQDGTTWLLFASISAIHDDLQQANQTIKQLQKMLPASKITSFQQTKEQEKRLSNDVEAFLRPDIDALRKQNKQLSKEILKISKENTKLQENLKLQKLKDKNFKKMLKIIESSDPSALNKALQTSKIDIRDLKSPKEQESKVITRSMAKKTSKKQQKKKESIFSSDDSSDFYNEDDTIRNIIKQMK